MKKRVLNLGLALFLAVSLSSCYTYTFSVGNGAQSGVEVTEKNHYVVFGLAAIKVSDPVKMAGGAANYTVTVQHTFIDGLLNALTGGIYTPTTTTVRK
jgi:hypothetical protein